MLFHLVNLEFTPIHFYSELGPALRGPSKSIKRNHRAGQVSTFRPYFAPHIRDPWIDVCTALLTLAQTGFQWVAVSDCEVLLFSGPIDARCFSLFSWYHDATRSGSCWKFAPPIVFWALDTPCQYGFFVDDIYNFVCCSPSCSVCFYRRGLGEVLSTWLLHRFPILSFLGL